MIRFQPGSSLKPALSRLPEIRPKHRRRRGHVEEDVAAGLVLGVELADQFAEPREGRLVAELARQCSKAASRARPRSLVELLARVELLDVARHPLAKRLGRQFVHGDADDGELVRQQAVAGQVVKRRHQQPLGQIARGAEDHHDARRGAQSSGWRL